MSQTSYSLGVVAPPIKALIIQPNLTYEVREIEQDVATYQELVGGFAEAYSTEYCVFWFDEEGKLKEQPCNILATYLWWKLSPAMARQDVLLGPVLVTGPTDDSGDSLPVFESVLEVFEWIAQTVREQQS